MAQFVSKFVLHIPGLILKINYARPAVLIARIVSVNQLLNVLPAILDYSFQAHHVLAAVMMAIIIILI